MKLSISYFYNIRFFGRHEVPLSTAVWDPKWFHEFKGQDHAFLDKRGVLNGVRASMFAPDSTCRDLCRGLETCETKDPTSCPFLQRYREQLETIDFDSFMKNMEQLSALFKAQLNLDRDVDFVLVVHEAPDNPCSERAPIQDWFKAHGQELPEWSR